MIAAEHATFGLPEPLIGVVAYAGGLHRLPRQIGDKRAMQLLLACETIDAAKALEWGLVNEVVPAAELDAAVARWLDKLLRAAPLALRATKQCVQQEMFSSLEQAIKGQDRGAYPALETMRHSADIREGIMAFAGKRAPVWRGE
ncbi:Carnitinyl-CoA dehydratase [compost metagenome]